MNCGIKCFQSCVKALSNCFSNYTPIGCRNRCIQCAYQTKDGIMYGSFDQIPVKAFKSTIDSISDSFPKTVPVEILCKGIYKSKGCVQSLRECITN